MNRSFPLKLNWHRSTDYSHFKTLGAEASLPAELLFLTPVLNQGFDNKCTAYAAVAVRGAMKGKEYDPEVQWQEELAFMGETTDTRGSDIRSALSVGVKTGFAVAGQPPSDNASAYFWVTKARGMDLFDSIRTAIAQVNAPLMAGLLWFQDWDTTDQGIVPNRQDIIQGGHAVKIAGWKTINGTPYLVIQNSWGLQFGDNGLFYFSREMTNKVFGRFGIGYWSDSPNPQIKTLGLMSALWANVLSLSTTLLLNFGFHP